MSVSSEWCKINTETFTLVIYPGFGQPPKPFEIGSDQTMVIRLMILHVILQNIKFIRLAISQRFLKIETSGLEQKIL